MREESAQSLIDTIRNTLGAQMVRADIELEGGWAQSVADLLCAVYSAGKRSAEIAPSEGVEGIATLWNSASDGPCRLMYFKDSPVERFAENLSYGEGPCWGVMLPEHPLSKGGADEEPEHAVTLCITGNGPTAKQNAEYIVAMWGRHMEFTRTEQRMKRRVEELEKHNNALEEQNEELQTIERKQAARIQDLQGMQVVLAEQSKPKVTREMIEKWATDWDLPDWFRPVKDLCELLGIEEAQGEEKSHEDSTSDNRSTVDTDSDVHGGSLSGRGDGDGDADRTGVAQCPACGGSGTVDEWVEDRVCQEHPCPECGTRAGAT